MDMSDRPTLSDAWLLHALRSIVGAGVQLMSDACDTDNVLWATRIFGQDLVEAEASGYLAGYRDALVCVKAALDRNPDPLNSYLDTVREEMVEAQNEVEELNPTEVHFWKE